MNYEFILTHIEAEKVGVITLNRPKQLNALSTPLMIEVGHALKAFDQDEQIGAIILQGNEKAFAAGADIQAMSQYNFSDVYNANFITRDWETINSIRKPVIAAVSGFALGGGCELAMMCDLIFASENAKFGQPEIKLGIIPGAGGTQRLPRAVGKARTMDMVLTGSMLNARFGEPCGSPRAAVHRSLGRGTHHLQFFQTLRHGSQRVGQQSV
jgi:enoyl-CoA hydratase